MFTLENSQKVWQLFSEKIETNKILLGELDTAIGDGDHGNNLSRGMTAVMESLAAKEPATVSEVFQLTAMALISKVGGASGPLYGTAVLEMAKKAKETTDALPLLEAGLAGIKKRGNSQAGEKTMIDLWEPAIQAIKDGQLSSKELETAVATTKAMLATKGRASYIGERSIGHIDPGAMSSKYLFEAILEAGVLNE